jgi:glycosyltransferase involved in cell wall biosynthesis
MMRVAMIMVDQRDDFWAHEKPSPTFHPAMAALLEGFKELPDCEIHVVSCTRFPMSAPAKLADNTWYHLLPVPRWGWLKGAYLGCIRAVRHKLAAIQPDIVHGQGTERYCGVSAAFSSRPGVLTVHGNMRAVAQVNRARPFSFLWLAARFERLTLPRVRGVVCITTHTRRMVEGLARETWLVPNAVETTFFQIPCQPPARPRLLCVGTICRHKNQNWLIETLAPLAEALALELVFAGEGQPNDPYVREFQRLVKAHPWCVHAGQVSRQQLQDHLQNAAMLVIPSLEDNCPMVVLEAMAVGRAAIGARVGGIPDLVVPGKTGWLYASGDAEALRRIVSEACANLEGAHRLGLQARATARERFHPTAIAQKHLEIYRQVLGTRDALDVGR